MLEKCNFCMSDVASALVNAQNKWKTWQILIETSRGMARERAPKKNTINYSHSHSHYSPHCPPPRPRKKVGSTLGPLPKTMVKGVWIYNIKSPSSESLWPSSYKCFHVGNHHNFTCRQHEGRLHLGHRDPSFGWNLCYDLLVVPRLADPWLPGSCWGIPRLKIFS